MPKCKFAHFQRIRPNIIDEALAFTDLKTSANLHSLTCILTEYRRGCWQKSVEIPPVDTKNSSPTIQVSHQSQFIRITF